MHGVQEVDYIADYQLQIRSENGTVKIVDPAPYLSGEIFEPLRDRAYFQTVHINDDMDTIVWDNGADFSPGFFYEIGQSLPVAHAAGAV
jgi:hypothetical protein